MYYSVPCLQTGANMPLEEATFLGASVNESFQVRVSGDPLIVNRGHSVTVVGGPLANLAGGWWENNLSIIYASRQIGEMVHELSNSRTPWLGFNPGDKFGSTQLVYSAGDADTPLRNVLMAPLTHVIGRARRKAPAPPAPAAQP